ncbi:hypothetical protein FDECE_7052 [Fusarium decemcellulare]|nr:hypothetical protein FDECE_7052 [Fusarium decemcellulare]
MHLTRHELKHSFSSASINSSYRASTSEGEMYRYPSLQSPTAIRLIDANFGRDDHDRIPCLLVEANLASPNRPPYHCLTYTWGNPLDANAPSPDHIWDKQGAITVSSEGSLCKPENLNIGKNLGIFLKEFERRRNDLPITIDYKRPVVDIYVDFAHRIRQFRRLAVKDPSLRKTAGLPSWVPDYTVPLEPLPWTYGAGFIYEAGVSGDETIQFLQSDDTRTLAVSGFHKDTVEYTGASYAELLEANGFIKSLVLLLKWVRTHECDGDAVEAFWRTLMVDLTGAGPRPPDAHEYGVSFRTTVLFFVSRWLSRPEASESQFSAVESLISSLNAAAPSPYLPDWESISNFKTAFTSQSQEGCTKITEAARDIRPYLSSLDEMFRLRRFFTTRKGRLGVGSVMVAPGDDIHIVKGSKYPMLLRPTVSGEPTAGLRDLYCFWIESLLTNIDASASNWLTAITANFKSTFGVEPYGKKWLDNVLHPGGLISASILKFPKAAFTHSKPKPSQPDIWTQSNFRGLWDSGTGAAGPF